MLQFGKRHLKRLQAKELFPYGLPLETTLCRVFQSIDNEKMADRMSAFAEVFRKEISASATDIICIDGKAMRGTLYDNGRNPNIRFGKNQRSLRYGLEDSIKTATPTDVYKNSILAHAALACVEALYAQFKT